MQKRDFRIIFLYEYKLGKNAADVERKINTAFGQSSASKRTIQRWFERFRSGDESLEELPGRGRGTVLNDEDLRTAVENNTRKTVRELSEELDASIATVSRHLKAIGKSKKIDKWIPHELTNSHKMQRYEICSSLILRQKNDPFLDRIITCDEKWILYNNRKRSSQWLDKNEAPKFFPKPKTHQKKLMVTVWWNYSGVIHYSFLNPGETITADKYCSELEDMHKKLSKTNPGLVNRRGPILLHDNARPHVAHITLRKLHDLGYETLPHPPYSPDLSPTDYHLFKHLDNFLKDTVFRDAEAVKKSFLDFLASRKQDFYENGMNKLLSRWQMCLDANGFYFK